MFNTLKYSDKICCIHCFKNSIKFNYALHLKSPPVASCELKENENYTFKCIHVHVYLTCRLACLLVNLTCLGGQGPQRIPDIIPDVFCLLNIHTKIWMHTNTRGVVHYMYVLYCWSPSLNKFIKCLGLIVAKPHSLITYMYYTCMYGSPD